MNQQCPRCAAAYASGSRFCQTCGLPLQASQPTAQAVYQAGAYTGQQGYAPPPQQYYAMPAPPMYPKAPLGERFWASVLDGFISLGLSLPTLICWWVALQKSRASRYDYDSYDPGGVAMLFLLGLFLYLIPLVYNFIKDGLGQGQSWGKRNVYLMVVDLSTNQPCGKGKSAARHFISALVCLIPFIGWLIECIMVLVSTDGRKLGDLAANTQVVHIDHYFREDQYNQQ